MKGRAIVTDNDYRLDDAPQNDSPDAYALAGMLYGLSGNLLDEMSFIAGEFATEENE